MTQEHFILAAISIASIVSIFYIPGEKYRLALISLVSFQSLTWLGSLTLVQLGVIEFPVREFPRATQGAFLQNFVFFPVIFVWFMLTLPGQASIAKKALHYFVFISIIAWFIYFITTYTDLEEPIKKGKPLLGILRTYINFLIYFIVCPIYIQWLSRKCFSGKLTGGGQDDAQS